MVGAGHLAAADGTPARVFDGVVAAVVAALAAAGVWAELAGWPHPIAFPAGAYLIAVAVAAVLLVRRRHPVLCTLAVLALVAGYHAAGYPGGAPALALFVALYSLAVYGRRGRSVVVAVIVVFVWQVIPALPPTPLPWYSYATTGPALGMLCMIALGALARQRQAAAVRAMRAAETAARAEAARRLAQERLGIARDVHDVLAHAISAIAVQSAVALDAFDTAPEQSRAAMQRVRMLAKQSLPELHRTVTALRGDGPSDAASPPQPDLAGLDALFAVARQAGLVVVVSTAGLEAVGPVTALCAYRVVQESLTNVVRHAGATRVDVTVRASAGVLRVGVVDDGTGAPAATLDGVAAGSVVAGSVAAESVAAGSGAAGGFGIRGMRERVAAVGGTIEVGPEPGGGYAVRAVLPLGGEVG